MLIIDPEAHGARLYTEEYTGFIYGDPYEVCNDLAHRLFSDEDGMLVQSIVPSVVTAGCGYVYVDCLERMGITVKEIQTKHYNVFLPQTC